MTHSYRNKKFSILGDSISTLSGFSEPYGAEFYNREKKRAANVFLPEDTWWGQVVAALGGEVLVNNSFSGSKVIKHPRYDFPSYGCSDERTAALGDGDAVPDVILVYLGTNDWGTPGITLTPVIPAHEQDPAVFSVAYTLMLQKLHRNYPAAEIWCFSPAVSTYSRDEQFSFPYRKAGRHLQEFCDVIRRCAEAQGCRFIDMYDPAHPYDTIDHFHPNASGMKTLADRALRQICAAIDEP